MKDYLKSDDQEKKLVEDISAFLKIFTSDYDTRIGETLMGDIVADIKECSAYAEGHWNTGDIALAVGRTLCLKLGIEI